jgi:hypothetical protein
MPCLKNPRRERFAQLLASGKSAAAAHEEAGYKPKKIQGGESAMMDSSIAESRGLTPAAVRMRRHRDRRNKNLRCLIIELRETEIDELIRMGLLKSETRNDTNAIAKALYAHFDLTLWPET